MFPPQNKGMESFGEEQTVEKMLSLRIFLLIGMTMSLGNNTLFAQEEQPGSIKKQSPFALHTLTDHQRIALTQEKLGEGNHERAGDHLSDAAHTHTSMAIKLMKDGQNWKSAVESLKKATRLHHQAAQKFEKKGETKKAHESKVLAETTTSMATLAHSHLEVHKKLSALTQSSHHTAAADRHIQEASLHQKNGRHKQAAESYHKAMIAHQNAAAAHELGGAKLSAHRAQASKALIEHNKIKNNAPHAKHF